MFRLLLIACFVVSVVGYGYSGFGYTGTKTGGNNEEILTEIKKISLDVRAVRNAVDEMQIGMKSLVGTNSESHTKEFGSMLGKFAGQAASGSLAGAMKGFHLNEVIKDAVASSGRMAKEGKGLEQMLYSGSAAKPASGIFSDGGRTSILGHKLPLPPTEEQRLN